MSERTPLVIVASINGDRSKDDNPNVPRSDPEIVDCALSCYDAGAAIDVARDDMSAKFVA